MLKIEHLTKAFGDKLAVDDLSLHIAPGEIYGFIGHNGAGKTTTLRSVAGIQQFDKGEFSLPDIPCAPSRSSVSAFSPISPTIPIFTTL